MITIANNVKFAKFMDWVETDIKGEFYNSNEGWSNVGVINKRSFCFHSDWNWLLEVVEKIESMQYFNSEVQFSITKYEVKIQAVTNGGSVIVSPCILSVWSTYRGREKMKALYHACLEFINWYNQQKNQHE